VEIKDDKVLQFFDILNALRDDIVIDFNAEYTEDKKDAAYEDEADDDKD